MRAPSDSVEQHEAGTPHVPRPTVVIRRAFWCEHTMSEADLKIKGRPEREIVSTPGEAIRKIRMSVRRLAPAPSRHSNKSAPSTGLTAAPSTAANPADSRSAATALGTSGPFGPSFNSSCPPSCCCRSCRSTRRPAPATPRTESLETGCLT